MNTKLLIQKLEEIQQNLDGHCEFWACKGPEKHPKNMITCYVCWTNWELKQLINKLKGEKS